jgi:riboflavin kinase/FMN adenylyltransferase
LLTTIDERCELFAELGIDMVVVVPFTLEFAAIPADVFVRSVIVHEIGVQHFFIGHDHSFGKNRGGNEELLQQLGHELDFDVVPIPPLECAGVVVSSTKVRNALKTGGVDEAHRLLGRSYVVSGVVGHGDKRGRTLGIPTANIQVPEHKLLPANGIYVVSSVIDGNVVVGMASVGVRPMFTNDVVPTLEVNYLDFDADLYGRTLDVVFHARLRDEINYESVDDLLAQIEIDRNDTRLYQQQFLHRRSS